ncbi:MAG: HAD family hydrolase [Acidimicrobiia bacterium]
MPLLLCDLDNTIVDRAAAFVRWATQFAELHGRDGAFVEWLVEIDDDGYGPRPEFFEAFRDHLGLEESVEAVAEDYYRAFLPMFRTDEAVRVALVNARERGWQIAIVTNGPATQEDKIRHAGLEALVDAWCVSGIEGYWKPDARLLEVAAERTGTSLAEAWMIGDNPDTDIGAANDAGIRSVWLRIGRVWPRDDFAPTHEADSFPEAVDLVLAHG